MDGNKLQAKIFRGLGIAAKVIGTPFDVYRAPTLIQPLAPANQISTLKASFTTGYEYKNYGKPNGLWTVVIDGTNLQIGDYITNGSRTYFIADKQDILPMPAILCSHVVSIIRPGYTTSGPMEATEAVIASGLPVQMWAKGSGAHSIPFLLGSESKTATPAFTVNINSRNTTDIKQHDVLIDSNGVRYEIDLVNFGMFGIECIARQEKS